jgi:FtsP/CotA-like multicopper oxidase with cupredoxin domain
MLSILSTSLAVNIGKAQPTDAPTLDPSTIPKFVNQLVIPPVYVPTYSLDRRVRGQTGKIVQNYKVDMSEFYEQILPTVDENGSPTGFAQTKVWGYGGNVKDAVTGKFLGYVQNSPGPTFEAIKGIPVRVTWHNNITTPTMFAVDPTIHWANPNSMPMPPSPVTAPLFPPGYFDAQSPAALVTHLHGGEVQSYSDGGPEAWWTASGTHGPAYNTVVPASSDSAVYYYPNQQLPTTLWYHDHALGLTRINVMSGLAGFYLLRDLIDPIGRLLPSGKYEVPLAIQDRSFNLDGSLWFPSQGQNPDIHPYWYPEFFGDTIMVNGKVWPNLNVDRGQYRFRLLDGSNARFYNLTFTVQSTNPTALPFIQIGSDGGYIKSPVTLTSLLISPGERADVLVDFSSLAPGTKVVITNDAPAPYSGGDIPDPETAGQIMQFTVESTNGRRPAWLPKTLNPTLNTPLPNTAGTKRILPLVEIEGENGPLMVTLNGQSYDGVLTETPRVGSTEDWYIVNLTPDWHPIHLHLTQFQLVKRIPFDADAYKDAWNATNGFQSLPFPTGYEPIEVDPLLYRTGPDVPLTANEMAWKDTVQAPNGTITVLRIRFAPQSSPITGRGSPTPGVNQYPFDPTIGPGYVWHCHIVDHEDNEMMRPYKVVP